VNQLFSIWEDLTKGLTKTNKKIADFIAETAIITALIFSLSMVFMGLLHQAG